MQLDLYSLWRLLETFLKNDGELLVTFLLILRVSQWRAGCGNAVQMWTNTSARMEGKDGRGWRGVYS